MRNSTRGSTSKINTFRDGSASNNAEKNCGKKLRQARLPFKVITPDKSLVDSKIASTLSEIENEKDAIKSTTCELRNGYKKEEIQTLDGRKRKLSYDDTDDDSTNAINFDNNISKENVILGATTKKMKVSTISCDVSSEVISLLEDEDDSNEDIVKSSISKESVEKGSILQKLTPESVLKGKKKGAGTPNTQKDKSGIALKLQIKLPLSAGKKNKRRKSKFQQISHNSSGTEGSHNNTGQELSSDDIEEVADALNPVKRKKRNEESCRNENETQGAEKVALISEPETEKQEEKKEGKSKGKQTKLKEETKGLREKETLKDENLKKFFEQIEQKNQNKADIEYEERKESQQHEECENKIKDLKTCSKKLSPTIENKQIKNFFQKNVIICKPTDEEKEINKQDDLNESVQSDNDNEADDETDNIVTKAVNISSDFSNGAKSKLNTTVESIKHTLDIEKSGKTPTPKQIKLMEQRRKAREEKERKLQEEKMKKQQEKEEKEIAKKREREEKEEQKRKEREEKEEQRRKEREEKERKRLTELEAKNEEKRKKSEAKEEELRRKEEERKRKEQEKEEAELKKKKAAEAFTKFFVTKASMNAQLKNDEDSNTEDGTKLLAFRPFQVKGDMKMAPIFRKVFTPVDKNRLDNFLGYGPKSELGEGGDDGNDKNKDIEHRNPLSKSRLYLSELLCGKIVPGKWRRISTESKDDVIIVEDELERVGQAIVEDTPAYIREQMRVKFYKFHDNRRPPYYGTWRKKSAVVKPRKPFAQDKKIFDYEVDSDDEWEEEEPGESLEDGSDDDKEKESEDDDYEVDNEWFVPHGHLSEEELQNEDEYGMGDENTREAQKIKLEILQQEFAQEMKKKTEKIKPRLIGCIWCDINGNQPPDCANILWNALEKKAMLFTETILVEEPEANKSVEPSSPSGALNGNAEKPTVDKLKPITLSDNMVKDLTRLIHGNNHSKNFLINEYIAYVEKTEESVKNGDLRKPLKSVIREKIDEMAEWQVVNANASNVHDMGKNSDNTTESIKKKKRGKRRLCWVVKQEILNKMNLSSLELQNSWEYTLSPKFVKGDKDVKTDENIIAKTNVECILPSTSIAVVDTVKGKSGSPQITKFTKVLTTEEKVKKLQNSPTSLNKFSKNATDKSGTEIKTNNPSTSQSVKEKKRVSLLMTVAHDQQNKLISKFLQKGKDKDASEKTYPLTTSFISRTVTSPTIEDDEVVILD